VLASSTHDGEADSPSSSSSFACLLPTLLAPPHSSPRSILAISSWRGGWKVSILFILLAITPKTHLIILEGGGLLFLGRYLLPELRGTPHSSPHLSISIESGLEDEGRVSVLFVLPPASPENWNSPYM